MGPGSRARSWRGLLSGADVGARDRAVDALEARLTRDLDVDVAEPGVAERSGVLADRDRARDTTGPLVEGALHLRRQLGERDHVRHGEPSAGPQHAVRLTKHGALVRGQVDHAVGDDDVDARLGQWDLLDGPFKKGRVL